MDVKLAFVHGVLEEEVNIEQPKGFINPSEINMVFKLPKALYGLKQAPRAWYERLHGYMVKNGFEKTNDNSDLYIKEGSQNKILLTEIFLDDIIFGGYEMLCK